jgi:hypothetical protein
MLNMLRATSCKGREARPYRFACLPRASDLLHCIPQLARQLQPTRHLLQANQSERGAAAVCCAA